MYGFDREFQRTVAREQIKRFGDTHDGYLVQVDFLHQYGKLENEKRRRQLSVLEACECVVAECGLGFSFEAEVERLRKAFLTRNLGSMRSIPSLDRLLMGLTVMRISADGKFGQKVVPLKT
jgi:hypothetical protein